MIRSDLADLIASDSASFPNGSETYVVAEQETYRLDTANAFAPFGAQILLRGALAGSGRWFRRSKESVTRNFTLWATCYSQTDPQVNRLIGFTPGQLTASGSIDPDISITPSDPGAQYYGVVVDALGSLWSTIANRNPGEVQAFKASDCRESGSPSPTVSLTSTVAQALSQLAFDKGNGLWVFGGDGVSHAELQKFGQAEYASASVAPKTPCIEIGFSPRKSIHGLVFDHLGNMWFSDVAFPALSVNMLSASQLSASNPALAPSVVWHGSHLIEPHGLAFGPTGLLWVADYGDGTTTSRLKAFDPRAAASGNPAPVITIDAAEFANGASDLAFDTAGNLWVMIQDAPVLARINAADLTSSGTKVAGVVITLASGDFMTAVAFPHDPSRSGLVPSGIPLSL